MFTDCFLVNHIDTLYLSHKTAFVRETHGYTECFGGKTQYIPSVKSCYYSIRRLETGTIPISIHACR